MIAPSPDWFIAVKNLSLFNGEDFIESVTVDGILYDAGTDSGLDFISENDDTNPAEPITLITTAPLGNGTSVDPPVATFRFQKIN